MKYICISALCTAVFLTSCKSTSEATPTAAPAIAATVQAPSSLHNKVIQLDYTPGACRERGMDGRWKNTKNLYGATSQSASLVGMYCGEADLSERDSFYTYTKTSADTAKLSIYYVGGEEHYSLRFTTPTSGSCDFHTEGDGQMAEVSNATFTLK